jgi:hypothetical protein
MLPESLVLSSEVLDSGGLYLLDNGADLLLYVDQEADQALVQVGLEYDAWMHSAGKICKGELRQS